MTLGYDARGNLTSSPPNSYTYTSENLMKTGPGSTSLTYDPLLRLYQMTSGANTTRFAYDGLEMVAEYNGSNALQHRYVYGPGVDEPIVQYDGSGTASRTWLHADERGSVIALTDSAGSVTAINSYDEYGIPGSANTGRFQYTGQEWLPEIGLYYYKARMYSPSLGRFMQTDPIGYADGLNWYNYAGGDPINFVDPLGLAQKTGDTCIDDDGEPYYCGTEITVTGGGGWVNICDGNCGGIVWPGTGFTKTEPALPKPQEKSQKLPRCLLDFLNRNTAGFDWSKVTLKQGSTWGGRSASTSLNTVTYANWHDRNDLGLTFHELGHMPQWASGRLTKGSYARESINSWWHGNTWIPNKDAIWDQSEFEQDAEEFRQAMMKAYIEEGSPCSRK